MYNEQMKDKEKIRSLESEARPSYKKGTVDLRNMNPDKYTGPRGATSFRQWGQDLKDLADRYSSRLNEAMAKVEYATEEVTKHELSNLGVEEEEDRQLRSAIRAFAQGEPRNFVSTEIEKGKTGLEVWRVLVGCMTRTTSPQGWMRAPTFSAQGRPRPLEKCRVSSASGKTS